MHTTYAYASRHKFMLFKKLKIWQIVKQEQQQQDYKDV